MKRYKAEAYLCHDAPDGTGMAADVAEHKEGDLMLAVDVQHSMWEILIELDELKNTVQYESGSKPCNRIERLQVKISKYLQNSEKTV